jgi:glycosyltransferase involved in cell wall biosynthesis
MSSSERLILAIYGATLLIWVLRHLALVYLLRKVPWLTLKSPTYEADDPPLVSVIIPAKDEELTLPACLESVLSQNYPRLEVLVVDDRSSDATAAVAQQFTARDSRVRVISIMALPEGWTGKTHALHVAANEAQGDWFWFIDADTRHAPESLSIMMEYARSENADLASLLPEMRCESFWECLVQPLAAVTLIQSFPLLLVNSDRSRLGFANGQYILARRAAYERVGGHESVRGQFVEDIYLAKEIKRAGGRIRVAASREISSTRMYTSLRQMVRGWSRIEFDAAGRRPWTPLWKVIDPMLFSKPAQVALLTGAGMWLFGAGGSFAVWLIGLAVVHHFLAATVLYRLYRMSVSRPWAVLGYPVANLVVDWYLLRACWMCISGNVTWRGTSYARLPTAAPPSKGRSTIRRRVRTRRKSRV